MIREQSALLNKARSSLKAANLLAREGYYEFAVSRAYYAMFYGAEALLLGEGLSFSKHSAVIAAFGKHFAGTGRAPLEFHRYLIEGQASRNISDYDIEPSLGSDEASVQISRAEKFIEFTEKLIGASGDNG